MSVELYPVKVSELPGAVALTGAEIIVGDQSGVTVTFTIPQLAAYVVSLIGGSSEITNTTIIAQLQNNSNWTDNTYTGTAITGQASGNFFVDSNFDYKFYSGGTKVRRIPFKYL